MPFNMPTYDTKRLSIGPGIVYLGPLGSTPTVDVGAIRPGSQLVTRRTALDADQGFPAVPIATFVTEEDVVLNFTTIEWNLQNLYRALGGGTYTTTASKDTFSFGGDVNMAEVAIKVVHKTPAGTTLEVYVWRGRGNGEVAVSFNEGIHEFPYSFTALHTTTDWNGASLPDVGQMARIVHFKT